MVFSIENSQFSIHLKCFIQFTCTNIDGCQKEGGNFFNLLQKEGGTQKGKGGPSEEGGGVPTLEETMDKEPILRWVAFLYATTGSG